MMYGRDERYLEVGEHLVGVMGELSGRAAVVAVLNAMRTQEGSPMSWLPGSWHALDFGGVAEAREGLGNDWSTDRDQLVEAIPPDYTEFIGRQMMAQLKERAA